VAGSFALLSPRGEADNSASNTDRAAAAIRSMEGQVLDASKSGLIEGIVLRYGMFYGPETPSTAAMINMVRKRRLPTVRCDAGLLPVIHIDDAVSATVRALEVAPAGAVYDIVDDQAVSLTEVVNAIAEYTGSAPPRSVPSWLPRLIAPYIARMTAIRLPLSNAKAKAELGWQPKYPHMRDGLSQMLHGAA
jgi:nucleoside-diphosphate-sugar epimerase